MVALAANGSTAATITVTLSSSTGKTFTGKFEASLTTSAGHFGTGTDRTTKVTLDNNTGEVEFRCDGDATATINATVDAIAAKKLVIVCGTGVAPSGTGSTGMSGPTGPSTSTGNTGSTGATGTDAGSINIAINNAIVLAGGGTTTVTATVKDSSGNAVPDGKVVLFTTTAGTLGTTSVGLAKSVVTVNGVAAVTFNAPSVRATATITASVTDAMGNALATSGAVKVVLGTDRTLIVTSTKGTLNGPGDISSLTATLYYGIAPDGGKAIDVVLSGSVGIGTLGLKTPGGTTAPDFRSIDDASTTASDGQVQVDFIAGGVGGAAAITFVHQPTLPVNSPPISQTLNLVVSGPPALALCVPSDPGDKFIRVKGSIGPNATVMGFTFEDSDGAPVAGLPVHFALSANASNNVTISPVNGVTDSAGKASTLLFGGGQAETVSVTASATKDGITVTGTSKAVAIISGIPHYSHLSWGCVADDATTKGFFFDGAETKCSLRVADRFSNSVDTGTQVNFRSEAGHVNATTTVDGSGVALATIQTANPRPTLYSVNYSSGRTISAVQKIPRLASNYLRFPHMPLPGGAEGLSGTTGGTEARFDAPNVQGIGNVTLIGVTQGEETFIDTNQNDVWDVNEPFIDLPEPFVDKNENGVQDTCMIAGVPFSSDPQEFFECYEDFLDLDGDHEWDAANGVWDNYTAIWLETQIRWVDQPIVQLFPDVITATSNDLLLPNGQPNLATTSYGAVSPTGFQPLVIGANGVVSKTVFRLWVNDEMLNCDLRGEDYGIPSISLEGNIDSVNVEYDGPKCFDTITLTDGALAGRPWPLAPSGSVGNLTSKLKVELTTKNDGIVHALSWPLQLPSAPSVTP